MRLIHSIHRIGDMVYVDHSMRGAFDGIFFMERSGPALNPVAVSRGKVIKIKAVETAESATVSYNVEYRADGNVQTMDFTASFVCAAADQQTAEKILTKNQTFRRQERLVTLRKKIRSMRLDLRRASSGRHEMAMVAVKAQLDRYVAQRDVLAAYLKTA